MAKNIEHLETTKPKWHSCMDVKVSRVVLELTGSKNEYVQRIRLETDRGNITYKPRKIIEEKSTISGFDTEATRKELFLVTEFTANNEMLVTLSKNAKEKPQEITLTYAEIVRYSERDEEFVSHFYLLKNQYETIYYPEYHKDDSNLQKQKEAQKKYAEVEM